MDWLDSTLKLLALPILLFESISRVFSMVLFVILFGGLAAYFLCVAYYDWKKKRKKRSTQP